MDPNHQVVSGRRTRLQAAAATLALAFTVAACEASSAGTGGAVVRLGYLANLTHAAALIGVDSGELQKSIGDEVRLVSSVFNAGPDEVQALFSGALDAAYMGPNPAINAFVKSRGKAIRVVAGATSGGAALVVAPGITSIGALRGKTLATPQRGNTQDVALRSFLASHGFTTTLEGGGDVHVVSQENAQTLQTFKAGQISGAWVPEPWASRLVVEGGGHVLVDEATLWPGGRYATTLLVVRTEFLKSHPGLVRSLLRGHVAMTAQLNGDPARARARVLAAIGPLSGTSLPEGVLERAWKHLVFTNDPNSSTMQVLADRSATLGFTARVSLKGLIDLTPLNEVLRGAGERQVAA